VITTLHSSDAIPLLYLICYKHKVRFSFLVSTGSSESGPSEPEVRTTVKQGIE